VRARSLARKGLSSRNHRGDQYLAISHTNPDSTPPRHYDGVIRSLRLIVGEVSFDGSAIDPPSSVRPIYITAAYRADSLVVVISRSMADCSVQRCVIHEAEGPMGGGGLGVGNAETRKYCRYNDGRSNRARARESRNKAARFIHASPREPPATLIHLARNQPFSPLFFAVPPSTRSGRALADRRIGALSDSARSRAADLCVVTRRPPSYGIATRATLVALYFASTRGRGEGGSARLGMEAAGAR